MINFFKRLFSKRDEKADVYDAISSTLLSGERAILQIGEFFSNSDEIQTMVVNVCSRVKKPVRASVSNGVVTVYTDDIEPSEEKATMIRKRHETNN